MASVLSRAMDLVERCQDAPTSESVGKRLFDGLKDLGARSLWARHFELTPNWTNPEVNSRYQVRDYARFRQADWWGSQAQTYADSVCPLAIGAARFMRPFLASDVAPHGRRDYAGYWEALGSVGVRDTLCVPHFSPYGTAEAFSIWLEDSAALAPGEITAIKLASQMALDRMRMLAMPPAKTVTYPRLTERERDCLSFVAEGKSDWEMSVILGVSQATAHTHVESAKRKLDARTRAQAVARLYRLGLH